MIAIDIETNASTHGRSIPPDAEERSGIRTPWDKKCALNPRLGRVVSVAVSVDGENAICMASCDEKNEKELVRFALKEIASALSVNDQILTFNGAGFDLPFLHARAAALGIELPYGPGQLLRRYTTTPHADLCAVLLNWDRPEKGDSLHGWCKSFGIMVSDETNGADIGAMVEANDLDGIRAHNQSDVLLAHRLGQRLAAARMI